MYISKNPSHLTICFYKERIEIYLKKLTLAAMLLLSSMVANSKTHWKVNKDHSEILFQISYLSFSQVGGRFLRFTGDVYFDEDLELPNKIKIKINPDSIFTGNKMRDQHLRGGDFFDVNKYQEVYFFSENIKVNSPGQYLAEGTLKIKGIKKNISLAFGLSKETRDSWGKKNKFAAFNIDLNRKDFNLLWNKSSNGRDMLIGDIVKVSGNIQLQPQGSKTAFSKHLIPNTKKTNSNKEMLEANQEKISLDKNTALVKNVSKLAETKKSWTWYLALTFQGLLAFFSILIFSFYGKNKLSNNESSTNDILTDLLVVVLVFLFAISFWIVGWGE